MYELISKHITKSFISTSAHLLICTLLASCAQVVAPGGGPVDKTPPKILKYSPDSAKLNFTEKSIEINFDEYVQLKDLNNQLIISPPLEYTPDITVKGKILSIELDKKEILKPTTTYAINFGNALQDYNENNPRENFKYIFSTGTYIDSLSVKGKVQNAFDHKTEKGIVVMLYSDQSDSVVYKKQPNYFSKTAANGTFEITNIKAGNYKIVALKDVNSNYRYDGETENIGFVDALIDVSKKENIVIDLFQEPTKKVHLKKYIHDQYGKIALIFNPRSDSIKVTPLNVAIPANQVILDFSKNKDTLTYWIKKFEKDSLKLQVKNGNTILDTLEFKMIRKEDALKSRKNPLKLKLLASPNGNQNFDLNGDINLVFNNPIVNYNSDSILFTEDSINISKNLGFRLFEENFCKIKMDRRSYIPIEKSDIVMLPVESIKLKEKINYYLFIPPGTITDIFGLTNDSIKIDFKTREEKYYGSIKLNITIAETKINGKYIVQLLDESEKVVRENFIEKSENGSYTYLHPKKYKLKIIYDENGNYKWDSGNYLQKQQPEKVIYYKELINIRSNWDLDLEWKISE